MDVVRSYFISSSDFATADAYYPAHSAATGSNFMFFAKTAGLPLTDGLQVKHSQQPVVRTEVISKMETHLASVGTDLGILKLT